MIGKRLRMLRVRKEINMQFVFGVCVGIGGYMFVGDPGLLAGVLESMSDFIAQYSEEV